MADSIRLEIKGLEEVKRRFELLKKNAPDYAARAINYTARDMRHAIQESIKSTFDRPTPFTVRSVFSSSARPNQLYSEVGIKEYQAKTTVPGRADNYHYMRVHESGGARPLKGAEYRLGGYFVPGAGAKLNAYGNISQGELQKIFAAIGANEKYTNTDINRTRGTRRGTRPKQLKRRVYWFGRVGKKQTLGIWAVGEGRGNERLRPVLIFPDQGRKAPRYRKTWPFFSIARKEWARAAPRNVKFWFEAWARGIK